MKIPQIQIEQTKQVLHSLWEDKLTVLRTKKIDHVIEDIEVYKDVLCNLSQSKQPAQIQSDTVATTKSIFTINTDTSIAIVQGDKLQIKHKNQIFEGVAGQPFHRNFSNVVPVEVVTIS